MIFEMPPRLQESSPFLVSDSFEQALLFGQATRAARERVSERLSREELRKEELSSLSPALRFHVSCRAPLARFSRVYFSRYSASGNLACRLGERPEPQVSIRVSVVSRATLA